MMPHAFGKRESRHIPTVAIAIMATLAIIVAAIVVVVGAATAVSYFLLAREEGEFTKQ
jgi:hypothetical protein